MNTLSRPRRYRIHLFIRLLGKSLASRKFSQNFEKYDRNCYIKEAILNNLTIPSLISGNVSVFHNFFGSDWNTKKKGPEGESGRTKNF